MGEYVNHLIDLIGTINDLPNRLAKVVFSIHEPIQRLTNTLVVTNVLLGVLVVTSIANIYMLWKSGKK